MLFKNYIKYVAVGYWEDPKIGWIEGAAIFVAVFLVSNISAFNDYNKELQFRALEASTQQDEKTSVFREGKAELISPDELVVGDIIILQVCSLFMILAVIAILMALI
jgi:Ca2+ transporting ATPase